MCNPPFFDLGEAEQNRSGRRRARRDRVKQQVVPSAGVADIPASASDVTVGSDAEMQTPGGEVGFVSRLVAESRTLQHSVRWYTSMVGRKSSLKLLKRELQACHCCLYNPCLATY